ncbi:Major Facilitator Superfamily protein [Sphingomonas laterariae]|uniref:Major Facilitator Superfamily protein n=1 Tax=Edaphosphingomonas laterariae TaxID=861865 RepID=A0A239HD01_9SPHN|nr:MFS transporter [Sphingomonas laterariae]SNS79240.1 Major Facilitator Superfamily protein [Sphingomonas laterariae]
MSADGARFLGPRMVALAFIAQSVAIGPTYGAFGPLVGEFERAFGMSRAMVSLPLSLVVLATGLLAPVIGKFVDRVTIRRTMMLGAVLLTLGYGALAMATSGTQVLAIYGLMIGPGVAFLGMLPSATLVTNWYAERQGRMIGIVQMPLMVMLVPLAVAWVLPALGFHRVLLLLAAVHALVLPVLLFVIDRPEKVGQQAFGEDARRTPDAAADATVMPMLQLLAMPAFLLIVLGSALAVGAGVTKSVHLVPLVTERGWSLEQAALLASISGGTGIAGSLLFGWLADRWGGGGALIANCVIQGIVWMILILPVGFGVLVFDAVVIGMCGGGFIAAKAVLVNHLFGRRSFAQVMGLSGILTVPFLFGMSPLAGWLRDWTGNYGLAVATHIAGFAVATLCFAAAALLVRRNHRRPMAGAVAEGA